MSRPPAPASTQQPVYPELQRDRFSPSSHPIASASPAAARAVRDGLKAALAGGGTVYFPSEHRIYEHLWTWAILDIADDLRDCAR